MNMNVLGTLTLMTDPDQALTHLVYATPSGSSERTVCGTEPAAREEAELPIEIALLCPGCFLYFTRSLAAHYHLPLAGEPGFPVTASGADY